MIKNEDSSDDKQNNVLQENLQADDNCSQCERESSNYIFLNAKTIMKISFEEQKQTIDLGLHQNH